MMKDAVRACYGGAQAPNDPAVANHICKGPGDDQFAFEITSLIARNTG